MAMIDWLYYMKYYLKKYDILYEIKAYSFCSFCVKYVEMNSWAMSPSSPFFIPVYLFCTFK